MIAIVSSAARERAALVALCESRGWPALECDSVRALTRLLRRQAPRVVVARQRLNDGYSDDILAQLRLAGRLPATKVIALIGAGTTSSAEARQVALGADCVQRDPVRIDVLLEYLAKYYAPGSRGGAAGMPSNPTALTFAGAVVSATTRTLSLDGRSVQLAPREMALVELFTHSEGTVLTYEALYSEILGRRFQGDTSNMRVLLGKLTTSAAALGIALRNWIQVIPKTGYRYGPPAGPTAALARKKPRAKRLTFA